MNKLFKDVSVTGIIEGDNIYILHDWSDRSSKPEPIEYLFTIRHEAEILPALDMAICTELAEDYELREFLGWEKFSKDCYVFKMRCLDKQEDVEVEYSLYLHRIMSLAEKQAWLQDAFKSE
jgi:hypothetical protein